MHKSGGYHYREGEEERNGCMNYLVEVFLGGGGHSLIGVITCLNGLEGLGREALLSVVSFNI